MLKRKRRIYFKKRYRGRMNSFLPPIKQFKGQGFLRLSAMKK